MIINNISIDYAYENRIIILFDFFFFFFNLRGVTFLIVMLMIKIFFMLNIIKNKKIN